MGASPLLGLGFGQWKGGIWEGIPPNHSPRVITSPREDSPETSKAIHSFTETWKLSPYQLCRYSAQTNPLKLRTTSDARPETRICKPIWKMAIRKITVIIARKLGNAPESSRISAVVRQAWSAIMMPIARKEQTRPRYVQMVMNCKFNKKTMKNKRITIWAKSEFGVRCNQNSPEKSWHHYLDTIITIFHREGFIRCPLYGRLGGGGPQPGMIFKAP